MPRHLSNLPTPEDFLNYRVTNPNQGEVIRQRLYDFQLYPVSPPSSLTFFALPVGSGIGSSVGAAAGRPKTEWDTNMSMGSMLPSGLMFKVESIEVIYQAGNGSTAPFVPLSPSQQADLGPPFTAAFNSPSRFYQAGMLSLSVLQKEYVKETPLVCFPPKTWVNLQAAIAATNDNDNSQIVMSSRACGRPLYVLPEILIQPLMSFQVNLKFPASVPLTFLGRVGVVLDGYLFRASQ